MNSFLRKIRKIVFLNYFLRNIYFFIYGFKTVERKITWMDEYKQIEFLKENEICRTSTPKIKGKNRSFYKNVPHVYMYSLKNVVGVLNSSSFYSEDVAFIERFRWIEQDVADYSDGHLIIHDGVSAIFKCEKRDIFVENRNALFLGGNGSYNYFHWMIEILPKLLILKKALLISLILNA